MELLEHIEIEPSVEARSVVIWLHGLGADGHDFEPIVPELNLEPDSSIRFIFPHAPIRPITINEKRPIFQGLLRAGNRIRTGDVQLGKLTLYQLSYSRRKSTHMIKAGLALVSREKERGLEIGVGEVGADKE